MTDEIDTEIDAEAEAEALARARYESGLPLLSNVGEEPAPPGTITSEGPKTSFRSLGVGLAGSHRDNPR
jgi:hypothetical protein